MREDELFTPRPGAFSKAEAMRLIQSDPLLSERQSETLLSLLAKADDLLLLERELLRQIDRDVLVSLNTLQWLVHDQHGYRLAPWKAA